MHAQLPIVVDGVQNVSTTAVGMVQAIRLDWSSAITSAPWVRAGERTAFSQVYTSLNLIIR